MDEREKRIREQHPDWSDEQVKAELEKSKDDPPADPPEPPKDPPSDDEKDKAFARLRRDKEAAEKRAKEAQDKLDERERKEAEDQGRFKDLAAKAEQEAKEAREKLTELEQRSRIEGIARNLKFRHPDEAINHPSLPKDLDRGDDSAVEQALKALAEERGHLIEGGPTGPTGGPGGPPPSGLTREDIERMSPEEVNERWDDVQKVLAKK